MYTVILFTVLKSTIAVYTQCFAKWFQSYWKAL